MYSHPSPPQSTTSLSEDEEEELDKSFYVIPTSPANWSTKPPPPLPPIPPTSKDAVDLSQVSKTTTTTTTALVLKSPASRLPPEVLIHVFRQLYSPRDLHSCLLVSRSWKEHDQTFTYPRFVRRLNFLALGQDLSVQLFLRLAACIRLERLTLVNCTAITDEALVNVLPSFPNLVALDLTCVTETTDRAIVTLANTASRLQGLNLGACKSVTNEGVIAIAKNCPQLRRIKLSGLELLTDAAVIILATSCPLLLEIDLNNCERITDVSVRELWTHSVLMREFRLSHCHQLTDQGFPAPITTTTTNSNKDASSSSTATTTTTATILPSVPNPNPFPNRTPILSPQYPPLKLRKPFEHLRMLDLTACVNITDEAIEGIVTNARKIRNLVLAKCSGLTDASVESICKLGKNLHYLHLGHASAITDKSVTKLARSCLRLRYIDLACCPNLTDMSVFELASLPKLRRIGLVRVVNLTDHAITMLGQERRDTLERIHLSYCENITVRAIHYLLQKLTKLTHLSLTGIPAFRHTELQKFCRPPPREFNSTQRAAFCVYSNSGVRELRRYLESVMPPVHDSADEYDMEEDEQQSPFPTPVGYIRDDSEELTGGNLARLPPDSLRTRDRGSEAVYQQHIPENAVPHSLIDNPDTTFAQGSSSNGHNNGNGVVPNSAATTPGWEPTQEVLMPLTPVGSSSSAPGFRRTSHGGGGGGGTRTAAIPINNHGQNHRTGGPLQLTVYPYNHHPTVPVPNGNVVRRPGAAPIQQQQHQQGQAQGRISSSNSIHSLQSNGTAFFNTVAMRREAERTTQNNGTATPDLVFAELGHGRQLPIDEGDQDSDWVLQERPDTPVLSVNGVVTLISAPPGGHGTERITSRQLRRIRPNNHRRLSSLSPPRDPPSSSRPSSSSSQQVQSEPNGRFRSPSSPSFSSPPNHEFEHSLDNALHDLSLDDERQLWRGPETREGNTATTITMMVDGGVASSSNSSMGSGVGNGIGDGRNRGRFGGLRAALANVGLVGNARNVSPHGQVQQGFTPTTTMAGSNAAGRR
ncbi:hypothetical protein Clacol_001314 [Clathrus columnatus]|uniref:F-box domain-containing protein n=1 Tax=Clathrus columnatus TaxID=1419009 RepID=A0AAV5A1D7_9AGAM|nr:hypothetical protein Clacol_001314 [Clathrus columnatus]